MAIRMVAPRPGPKPEPVSHHLIRTLIHPSRQAQIGTVFFAPTGKWIAGCGLYGTGGIQVWDATTGKQLRNIPIPEDYSSQYDPLPPPPDGHTLYLPIRRDQSTRITKEGHPTIRRKVDGAIQVWDLTTGREVPSLRHTPPRGALGVAVSSDGNWLAAAEYWVLDDAKRTKVVIALWDVQARKSRDLVEGRQLPSFAPDSKTLAASFVDGESKRSALALWDVASGKRRTTVHSAADYYGVPVFSPDGRYVAVSLIMAKRKVPEVKLWEVATGKEVGAFAAPEKALEFRQPAFSPDGRWLAAATFQEGKVFLYDVPNRKLVRGQDLGNRVMLRRPVFSPDGKCLAVPGQVLLEGERRLTDEDPRDLPQPRVFLFDVAAGSEPEVLVAPHGFVGRAAFSPDGRTLALGGDGRVWLFNILTDPK